jgi:hypothetical protein
MIFGKITHNILWVYYGFLRVNYGNITGYKLRGDNYGLNKFSASKKPVFSHYYGLKVANYGVEVPITANYG